MLARAYSQALALGLACAGAPVAAESVNWTQIGEWDIAVDTTIDNGCYALAGWDGGTVLRIGRNPLKENFYMLIGNDSWASLQHGVAYEIQVQFGGQPRWDVSAVGLQFAEGETAYLHAQSTQMEFIEEFQRALNMKISYDGKVIDNLKLTGSRRAWEAVEACQSEVAARGAAASSDPFASGAAPSGRKAADPFASN